MPVSKIGTNALASGLDVSSTNISYTGTLTGGTGVVNFGSGQFYKDASGNVGIGTSSPNARLDAYAAANFVGVRASSGSNALTLYANSSGTQAGLYTDNANPILFWNSGTERARIDSSGNLLVGATGTGSFFDGKLNVYGSGSQPAACFKNDGTGGQFTTSHWNTATSGTRTFTKFVLGSTPTEVGSISSTGTSTTYATSSDYRLKENIQPMTGALAKVAALKPCTYKWKADGSDGEGFIAHELQAVVPQCVTGEKDAVDADGKPVYQGIDTSFLVATLTAAIQELKAELDSVKAELAVLKGV